jgi:hypothetical protein
LDQQVEIARDEDHSAKRDVSMACAQLQVANPSGRHFSEQQSVVSLLDR